MKISQQSGVESVNIWLLTLDYFRGSIHQEPDADELDAMWALFAGLVMSWEFVKQVVGWNIRRNHTKM
jgi:hypothetical protein